MQYRKLGRTGFDVSAVSYGGIVSMEDGQAASDRYVAWALERGINYFDVAPTYGDAEEKLGNSIAPHRSKIRLACKTAERLKVNAQKELKRSQELLHTDYFDVYQLHAISSMEDVDIAFGPGGVMEMVREMKEKGIGKSYEDVLSYALFPQVAEKFFAVRDAEPVEEPAVRELVVEDLSN